MTSGQIFEINDDESGGPLRSSGGADGSGGAGGPGTGGSTALGGAAPVGPGPTGAMIQVAAGDLHTCGVVDGGLYCWGDNSTGALGLGDFNARVSPTRVGTNDDWVQVGVGGGFSCGLRSGQVWCFGSGSSGELGAGQFSDSQEPVRVMLPSDAVCIGVDQSTACAILDDQSLHCWGANAEGQLGQGDPFSGPGVNSAVPLEVAAGASWDVIDPGQGHTCGLQTDGSLWCWGRNARGELGQGAAQADQTRVPEQVGTETDWTSVECGQNHTCGIRGGALYCWGDNSHDQVHEDAGFFVEEPLLIPIDNPAQVSIDTFHTCAIDGSGDTYCWGRNVEGQLADGTVIGKAVPTLSSPEGSWEQIDAGRFHTCGVRDGTIYCAGDNAPGRLGTGDLERRSVFSPTVNQP